MNDQPTVDGGSFRDPSGHIYALGQRILRTVTPSAAEEYEFVRETGCLSQFAEDGMAVEAWEVDPVALGPLAEPAQYVLEHPRIPFISYPYEWPFPALKSAALLHLDIQLSALEHDVALSDASAYNVQFLGTRPVFIDHLSFRRYQEGEIWAGHAQFCEQFLNPLLIRAFLGVAHNDWFRGRLEGIATPDLNRLLPFRRKFAWNVLAHVVLPARLQQSVLTGRRPATGKAAGYRLPRAAFRNLLMGLRRWIALLHPADTGKTVWVAYPEMHGYSTQEESAKRQFVADFVDMTRPDILWDLGCNSGEYSELALSAGAARVIGFDFDQGALERAFARSDAKALAMQPLYLDAANPSPQQGWNADERKGLQSRAKADALLALAFFHHLAVGRNIPMDRAIDWIIGLAPRGVIEFVPKSDPAIVRMLLLRSDIFKDYSEATFLALIKGRARIVRSETVSDTGRRLVWYDRTDHR